MSLKLAGVKINNVLGIQDLEITPEGNVIEVSGKNGSGKTSTVEAIKSALGISEYSTLLRNGQEKGEVVLDLGDLQIKKTHKQGGETLTVKGKVAGTDKMTNINAPATLLKSLVNPNSVDPVRLLTAKPKDLLDAVMEAIPLRVDPKKFEEIYGDHSFDLDTHGLLVLAAAHKNIMEQRKLVNRDAKTAKTTKEQLAATLPDTIPTTEELEAEIEDNIRKSESIRSLARSASRDAKKPYLERAEKLSVEKQELLDKIAELTGKLNIVNAKIEDNYAESEVAADDAREAKLNEAQDYLDANIELSKQLSQLNIYKTTERQVKDWENKESEANKLSTNFTKTLGNLQAYKEELCKNLPIKGLEVKDGLLVMDGVSFETLNTASRVNLVIELAKLTSGDLGIVILDNSECMDRDTYKLFLEEAAKTDLIFIVARVSDSDFSVK